MRKFKIYIHPNSEDGETPTSFQFKQPLGCDKVWNSYKNLNDNYKVDNISSIYVYGYKSKEDLAKDVENFKSKLPKYLHKYVTNTIISNYLDEDGWADYKKSEPAMEISVSTRHEYSENKSKKINRLYKEIKEYILD